MAQRVWQTLPIWLISTRTSLPILSCVPRGERAQVDALGCEVLAKVALVHIEPARLRRLDGLCGQKGNLTVPMPGVRIGGEAKLLDDGVVPVGDG